MGVKEIKESFPVDNNIDFYNNIALASAFAIAFFSAYIGWRSVKNHRKDVWVRRLGLAFAAIGGTSFRGADLTDANFAEATLKSTDFRKAIITRTCWKNAKKLYLIRPGTTYLNNEGVLQLITGKVRDKNFDRQNLQGVNLQGANLVGASFIEANLNETNLQDADLSDAKLVHTQLDRADITGATLTGAYIEEWNITSDTKLYGIRCDYVYMRLPPKERPAFIALPPEESGDPNYQRKPDDWNKNFVEGEFVDFIEPMRLTRDLYHNQQVDPRLMAIAFQQLKDNHPDAELEVVSVEKKGKNRDKLMVRADTVPHADRSELNSEYFDNLEYLKSLSPEALQVIIADRGSMIKMLTGILEVREKSPDLSINNNQSIENTQSGEQRMTGDQTANITSSSSGGDIIGNVGGDFNKHVSESGQNLAEAAAEIQNLLQQLEESYSTETTTGRMQMATETIDRIDRDPALAQRILRALGAGSTAALESLLDHPAASFAIGALEDWRNSKQQD
ncbi:MAG: pentapeptide repeat-containing protein [Hormoscilla sp. GM7CHS1pb]|nr:pentapeptide repeat-containing protein [Hormoscilla sp. GM7CHS1pb]